MNGLKADIIVMGGLLPDQLPDLVHHRLTPVLSSLKIAKQLGDNVRSSPHAYAVHVKVDTGMRRLGVARDQLVSFLGDSLFSGPLTITGLMTHFADADSDDPTFTNQQIARFQELTSLFPRIPVCHAANTAAILSYPSSYFGMVRPGLMLYGYAPTIRLQHATDLQQAMRLTTTIVHVRNVHAGEPLSYNGIYRTTKPSRIAILPIGYSHGFDRRLGNHGWVLVGEHRAPIVGNICMDMTFVDITDFPMMKPGDEVVLLGTQGDNTISAHDLAEWQGTIPYEVLCGIGPRVRRVYEPLS